MAEPTEDDFLTALEEQQALAEDVGLEDVPEQQIPQQVQAPVQEQEETPAFTQWEDYRNDPRFSDLAPAQKQNLFDDWQKYATEYLAQNGELSTEEDVKYTEGIFTDIAKIDNLRKPIFNAPNYVEELVQQAQSGYGALEAGTAGYASALGMTDTATASNVISQKYRDQRDRYVNPELKKFTEEQAGFFASAGKIITNPFDIATPLFMQSMGSSAPAVGAGIVAGVAGTAVAGPAGGIAAGLSTAAVGSGIVEGVVNFNQMVIEEVGKRGLDPAKAEDIQAVLDDPTFVSDAVAYSAARGVVIGAAELATFGAGKYIGTALRGVNAAGKVAKTSGLRKVAIGTAVTGVETVGEGVGETGAQIVAPLVTGKPIELQPGEIAAEMFVQAPASVAKAGLQTARVLIEAGAPASASEVTREAVQAAAEGKYEQVLGVQPSAATPNDAQKYYDGLSIAEKARVLGMAPNVVLTQEQGTYSSLSEEEKGKVQIDFSAEAGAQQGPTVEEAEATAREAFQPAPVVEAEAPVATEVPAPVAETPAPVAETAAPVQPLDGKPLTEQKTSPLEQVAPASAQAVSEEQAPVAEAPAPVPTPEAPVAEAPAVEALATQEKDLKEIISDAADSQRGKPESVMMDVTMKLKDETASSPSLIDLLEHVGDLSNRAQKRNAITNVEEKIRKVERYGQDGRNTLEGEIEQGYRENAEYRILKSIPELAALRDRVGEPGGPTSLFEVYERLRKEHGSKIEAEIKRSKEIAKQELKKYVEAHEKFNKPVTKLGKLGKDAAIALGNQDFNKLRSIVSEMRKWVDLYNKANEQKRDKMFNELAGKPAPAPLTKKLSPTKGQVIDIGNLNLPQLTELRNNLIQQDPGEYQVDREAAQRIFGKYGIDITGISDAKILDISRKFAEARKMAKNEGEVEAIFKRLLGTPASTPTTPLTKKLPPTKKQVTALSKLGYLPADIEALDRVQAKNILSNQTPKVPIEEAQEETEAVVPPQGEPTDGKVDQPVAPTATAPTAEAPIEERLTEAEKKLQAKVGEVVAEADKLGVDEESVKAWLGPTPSEGKILRARVVLRLLNLGLADVYNNIRKVAAKTRGKQGELTQEGGPKIKRVVFTTREEGAGLLSNPEDMNSLDVIYVNPDRLLSRLRADLTTDAADFFVKVLEEELLHLQHGWAAFDLFAGTVPEDQINPENFKNFFRKQSEEIEDSLTIGQIQEVVGKYAGIDTAGKTKEQLIQEFAQVAGRRGRLAEEYLRTLIQRRMLGDITEDKVRGLTPNSVLRSLGMIKNWLGKFVGETIPKKYANQTPVERYYTAVSDLIYGNAPAKIREARDEQGTAISGKQTLTASLDPMAIRKRFEQTTYQKELVKKINEDFGLGKPREAKKGAIWAKTVGKLIGQFPTFKPDEVEAIVGEDIPDAVKFFDPSQGAVFTTYLYQRAFRSLLDARGKQRRTGIYESGRTDVAGSVERARFQPLSEQIKKVEKPKDVTAEATAEEIASELESQESAAEEAANSIVSRDADEVVQKYAEVVGKQAEEEQSFEEMLGPKTISGELTAPGFSPSQAAARNDLSKVFDQIFASFPQEVLPSGETASREQDVFDFLFRAEEMENPPTRQGIMAKYNLGHSRQYDRIVESVREKVANTLAENNIFSAGQLSASVDPVTAGKIGEIENRSKEFLAGVPDKFVLAFGPGGVVTRPYWVVRSKNQITQDNLKTVQVAFMDRPISDLAAIDERGNVSVRTLNFLGSSNINNIEELMGLTEDKVRSARNTAPSTWDEVKQLQGIVNEMFAVPESAYFRTIKQARNALALTREKDPEAKAYGADGLDIDETEDFSKKFFGGTLERNIRSLSELLIDSELLDEGVVIHFADGRIGKPTFIVPAGGSREMGEAGVYFPSAEKADQMVQTLQKIPAFKDSYSKEIVSNITGQKFWQVYWGNRDTAENVVAIKKNNYEGGMEAYGMAFGYRPELVKDFAYKDYKEVENINLEKAKKVLEGEIIDKLLKFAAGDLLSGSVDPMATQALKRSLLSVPEAISNLLKARTYFPYENKELLQKANDFVDANAGENDIFQAKIALDRASETQVSNPERIITLGVIGKRLLDAVYALDQQIKKDGNTPELSALRDKYSNDLHNILSVAQDILSASGQDLQAGRVFANLFSPEQMVRVYTKPIADAQKKLLAANAEIIRLRALIQQLKNELATKAVGKVIIIQAPEPESKFYDFLGLFGDIEPNEQESFQEYLTRIGIDYPALMVALETSITASVDPTTNANPLPKDFRNLNAREAIKQLVALDKNFFSKLVNLRAKTGAVATTAEVARAQTNKSRKSRPLELQMIFDFFNTSESEKPTSEEPIEKDTLPVMVRLAKYASDAVTDRVLKSLGMDKKTTPKGLFDTMEKQVRKFVNAQFREETNPQKTAVEDTRTPEQKLMDLVERIGLAEQIFNQTKESLQARLNEDTRLRTAKVEGQMSDAERTALQAAVNKTFDAGKILTTAKEVRELVDFRAEARKHISQRGATVGSLSRLIKEKLPNLNDAQVKALADLITANYNRLVKDSGATQLKNILKQSIAKESKEPKKEIDQMLELLNLGAFNEEKFYNAIADRFGLPAWDEAVVADIRKRGEAVERLPQGSDQRTVAALQLQGFIAQKLKEQAKGYAKAGYVLDVMGSVWKAGVLSGFGTQSVNLLSTAGNVGLELLTSAIGYATTLAVDNRVMVNPGKFIYDVISTYIDNLGRVAPQEAMDAFATGFGRLRSENQKQVTPLEAFSVDTNRPKGAKATAKWTLNNYLGLWKLVGRAMAAADTFNASIAHEAKLRMQMRYLLMSEKSMTPQQADEIMKDLFSADSDMMSGVREQVANEATAEQFGNLDGLDPKSLAYRVQNRKIEAGKRRRISQLREQAIATEVAGDNVDETVQGIKRFTEVATFNNNPIGLLGFIGDKISEIGAGFPLLQPFTSFTRTVANVVNASLNYTPYGFFRLAGGSLGNFRKNKGGKYEFESPQGAEFYKLATQATLGTLTLYALNSLFWQEMEDPWDKAKFAVTGLGPSDPNKRAQLRATGWAENSVKVTTPLGPFQFRHSDIPGLSLVLGALGMMSDSYRYGSLKDEDKITIAAYVAASMGSVVFEKNLLSGAKSLFDILKLREDPVAALQKGAGQYVGGITNPGLFKWLAQTVGVNQRGMVEQIDYRKLNSTVPGFLLGLTPVGVKIGSPKLNRLGEPVEEYPWAASTKRVGFLPEVRPHPVFSPLAGADLFVPGISRLTKINVYRKGRPEQVRVDITEDIYYDYAKYNGQYLKRVLTPARAKSLASRAKFDREAAQDELQDLAKQAKQYAVDRVEAQIRTKGLGR